MPLHPHHSSTFSLRGACAEKAGFTRPSLTSGSPDGSVLCPLYRRRADHSADGNLSHWLFELLSMLNKLLKYLIDRFDSIDFLMKVAEIST